MCVVAEGLRTFTVLFAHTDAMKDAKLREWLCNGMHRPMY